MRSTVARVAKYLAVLGLILLLPKVFVLAYASYQRSRLVDRVWDAPVDQERVERFARWAANNWVRDKEKPFGWEVLRRILPRPFKPNKAAIIFLSGDGSCSDFVKAARWVFRDRLRLVQHDVMSPTMSHSAVSVQLGDGRWVFIDPYMGWIFKDAGRLLSLKELRARLAAGNPVETYAVALKKKTQSGLYEKLLAAADAKEFETLDTRIRLPVAGKARWSLGQVDGDYWDVQKAGERAGLTTHFFYVGVRYSRKFRFTYIVPGDGRSYDLYVRLTREPEADELPRFSVPPSIEGKALHFRLGPEKRKLVVDSSTAERGEWYAIDQFEVVAAGDE